jgi:hypothetical protein
MVDLIFKIKLIAMSEKVMVATGAFATHTTKLYNYYVCPQSWDVTDVKYIAVNYFNQLKYVGEVLSEPFKWSYIDETITGLLPNVVSTEVMNDLNKFSSLFNSGSHYLFILNLLLIIVA